MERATKLSAIGAIVAFLSMLSLASHSIDWVRDQAIDSTGRAPKQTEEKQGHADYGARALNESRPININKASIADLELLPGIGPKLAARIHAYRQQHGQFKSVEALDQVPGIGPRKLERLRRFLAIEEKRAKNN